MGDPMAFAGSLSWLHVCSHVEDTIAAIHSLLPGKRHTSTIGRMCLNAYVSQFSI